MTTHNNYFIITQGQASRLFPNEHDPQTPDWYMYAHMDMWDGFILYLQYQNSVSLLDWSCISCKDNRVGSTVDFETYFVLGRLKRSSLAGLGDGLFLDCRIRVDEARHGDAGNSKKDTVQQWLR